MAAAIADALREAGYSKPDISPESVLSIPYDLVYDGDVVVPAGETILVVTKERRESDNGRTWANIVVDSTQEDHDVPVATIYRAFEPPRPEKVKKAKTQKPKRPRKAQFDPLKFGEPLELLQDLLDRGEKLEDVGTTVVVGERFTKKGKKFICVTAGKGNGQRSHAVLVSSLYRAIKEPKTASKASASSKKGVQPEQVAPKVELSADQKAKLRAIAEGSRRDIKLAVRELALSYFAQLRPGIGIKIDVTKVQHLGLKITVLCQAYVEIHERSFEQMLDDLDAPVTTSWKIDVSKVEKIYQMVEARKERKAKGGKRNRGHGRQNKLAGAAA